MTSNNQIVVRFEAAKGQLAQSSLSDNEKELMIAQILAIQAELSKPDVNSATLLVAEFSLNIINKTIASALSEKKLKELALLDKLTGLPQRHQFEETFIHVVNSIKDGKLGSATLIVVDCNDFRDVNNYLGHNTGDRALQAYAHIMRSNTPSSDYVYRTGGDEFVIIIEHRAKKPHSEEHNLDWLNPRALLIVDKVRQKIAESYLTTDHPEKKGVRVPLGISCGIVNIDPDSTLEQNMAVADLRLYADKGNKPDIYADIRRLTPLKNLSGDEPLAQPT